MIYVRLLVGALACAGALTLTAAPSRMRPVELTAPDGTSTTVTAVGDEHHHWFETSDGRKVSWLPEVNMPKATPSMRRRVAAGHADASARATHFPTRGELPFLVILVSFPDMDFTFADPAEEFSALLNEPGYDRYKGRGSAADYFRDNSAGVFIPRFEVAGPVRMKHGYSYYGGGPDDSAAGLMVLEACRELDNRIDFSRYDLDGDGMVDNIYFFYAGKGEADGGDPGTIWPHSWNLSDKNRELTLDGVAIDAYACSPELDGEGKPNGIGTFCHEFSHVLGLPDLYASSMSDALHPATWSLMASGNYNEDGRVPPGLSAYERMELGWLQPKELSYPLDVTLRPIGISNDACRISTMRANEYFLLESRYRQKWDSSLPGQGMLVWHIDYNPDIWDRNVVNANASHQYVDIVEANNATSHTQDSGFPFPGSARVTSLTASTRPALLDWAGNAIDCPITDISEGAGGEISFKVSGGKTPVGKVAGLRVASLEMESCILEWEAAAMAESYTVSLTDAEGRELSSVNTAETRAKLEGLWPGKHYLAHVSGRDRYENGPAAEVEIEMPAPTFEYLPVEAGDPEDITASSFSFGWTPLDSADSYEVTVAHLEAKEGEPDIFGFDGRLLPEGWKASGTSWSSVAGYYGDSAPGLRFATDGATLEIPSRGKSRVSLSMFLRAGSLTEESSFEVTAFDASGKVTDTRSLPLAAEGRTVTADAFPVETESFRLTLHSKGGTTVTLDDIALGNTDFTEQSVAGWNPKTVQVSAAPKVTVEGLASGERYCYSVTARQGALRSQPSRRVSLQLGKGSAVADLADTPVIEEPVTFYRLDGRLLRRCANASEAAAYRAKLPRGIYLECTVSETKKIAIF